MKKIFYLIFISTLFVGVIWANQYFDDKNLKSKKISYSEEIHEGDLIFQTSLSSQSKAIQLATNSIYSHCGIIFKKENELYVFEAIQPVKYTKLEKWIDRGKDQKYVIKRLKNATKSLTKESLSKLKTVGLEFIGKDYDLTFEWSDEKIYCSELIWKMYKNALGIEIGKLQKLKDFDLSNKEVKKIMMKRYGENIPKDEIVISPESIFKSELLETIISN